MTTGGLCSNEEPARSCRRCRRRVERFGQGSEPTDDGPQQRLGVTGAPARLIGACSNFGSQVEEENSLQDVLLSRTMSATRSFRFRPASSNRRSLIVTVGFAQSISGSDFFVTFARRYIRGLNTPRQPAFASPDGANVRTSRVHHGRRSPAVSKCSLIPNACQSYFDPDSIGQNHCAEVLAARSGCDVLPLY